MVERVRVGQSEVAAELHAFVENEVLPGLDLASDTFWRDFDALLHDLAPANRDLLAHREALQAEIDAWHKACRGQPVDPDAYRAFLAEIGYLMPEGPDFNIETSHVDDEIAHIAGPQLVVPVTNARYALNAANARWGSLYDALYGTDAIPDDGGATRDGDYNPVRGAKVIAWTRAFLDEAAPLAAGSHGDVLAYRVEGGALAADLPGSAAGLADPGLFVGYRGDPAAPGAVLLRHNGLHIEIAIDRAHPVGRTDQAGVSDVVLESAVTTIVDLEDSIAAVDAEDKVLAYRNWLGLINGDLAARFVKNGGEVERRLNPDRRYTGAGGGEIVLPGRSLMLNRNVGHLMNNPAVLDGEGREAPEGILDAVFTCLIALHDLKGNGAHVNSRAGSIYIVKPKLHGPEEVAFTDTLFARVEDMLGLERDRIKIGIMDEERRLHRQPQGVHPGRAPAGGLHQYRFPRPHRRRDPHIDGSRPDDPQGRHEGRPLARHIRGLERRYRHRLRAARPRPDRQGHVGHAGPDGRHAGRRRSATRWRAPIPPGCPRPPPPPCTRATTTASGSRSVRKRLPPAREPASTPSCRSRWRPAPTGRGTTSAPNSKTTPRGSSAMSCAGSIRASAARRFPDIDDIGLMEDRATCRISSQHMANWLHHGVCTADEVQATMRKMAGVVDRQNAGDPAYTPMAPAFDGPAFKAACDLVFQGREQPSGYTEPVLHRRRAERKALDRG